MSERSAPAPSQDRRLRARSSRSPLSRAAEPESSRQAVRYDSDVSAGRRCALGSESEDSGMRAAGGSPPGGRRFRPCQAQAADLEINCAAVSFTFSACHSLDIFTFDLLDDRSGSIVCIPSTNPQFGSSIVQSTKRDGRETRRKLGKMESAVRDFLPNCSGK